MTNLVLLVVNVAVFASVFLVLPRLRIDGKTRNAVGYLMLGGAIGADIASVAVMSIVCA